MTPKLKHVCDIDVDVGSNSRFGPDTAPAHHYHRGGRAHGPRLVGEIVPGSADWQYVRGDGVVELEARYSIRTSDDIDIASTNRGL